MTTNDYQLGTVEASEQLIRDLYVDLRSKVAFWASLTRQTAQARMGYVGQHLVSAVTGHMGGRSGARGRDLVLSGDEYGEIKTCYRVDQLGKCNSCGAGVASIEDDCEKCGSTDIQRNDDSKWLIGIRNQDELARLLEPTYYFLVLFEFKDVYKDRTIIASIWRVDPKVPGFALCMVDYEKNIRARSRSKAPFNLWPYQLKFYLMRPELIYRSIIDRDGGITTVQFPERDASELESPMPLTAHSRSRNLTKPKILEVCADLGCEGVAETESKGSLLARLDERIEEKGISAAMVSDTIARQMYLPDVSAYLPDLPEPLKSRIDAVLSGS